MAELAGCECCILDELWNRSSAFVQEASENTLWKLSATADTRVLCDSWNIQRATRRRRHLQAERIALQGFWSAGE